jgi:(p)ppGpp synthase/HD superfamily hydrolase
VQGSEEDGLASVYFTIDITDIKQLDEVLKGVKRIPNVYLVERK